MTTPHHSPASPVAAPLHRGLLLACTLAAAGPSLLAYNVAPSPTFLNQALALAGWGAVVVVLAMAMAGRQGGGGPGLRAGAGAAAPLLGALALLGLAVAGSWAVATLPGTLALSALGLLAAAAVLVLGGAVAEGAAAPGCRTTAADAFVAFCWAWLAAALLNAAVAGVQVFAPAWADGNWIAASGHPGRAVGNLRQPNHLSSVLLWGCIALVALVQLRRLAWRHAAPAGAVLVLAVVLSASRTGLLSVLLLALWGGLDHRLARPARGLLLAAPLVYALAWAGMAGWAALGEHAFSGAQRLAESDISGSRFGIWANTLQLIAAQPWTGVGFGRFNLAWAMTPFPGRPTAFFDHTHNLPLQLWVELGLPLGSAVLGLLGWGLWRTVRGVWRHAGDTGAAGRCALLMVLMIGLHSLLEYPLWYAYFLLPTAFAAGFALGVARPGAAAAAAGTAAGPGRTPALAWAGAALVAGAALAVWDYTRVVAIFKPMAGAPPLAQRIATGQASLFFGHHADYAAVTSRQPLADPPAAFARATHYLLDTRLMIAWAQALAEQGNEHSQQAARHVADRLREFRKADAEGFFAVCEAAEVLASAWASASSQPAPLPAPALSPSAAASAPAGPDLPFQCRQATTTVPWRSLPMIGP